MAAMIWDEQAQAYTEAETPMKYDPSAGAWAETTGLAYNPDAAAWEEKWSMVKPLYLYNDGVWDKSVGQFSGYVREGSYGTPIITIGSDYFSISTAGCGNSVGACASIIDIDITKYSKLCMDVYMTSSSGWNSDSLFCGIGNVVDNKLCGVVSESSQPFGSSDNNNMNGTIVLDISTYSGKYKVFVGVNDNNSTACNSKFHKIWVE